MSKWSRRILFFGILLGFTVGGIMGYIALQHNPQNEFTENPKNLLPIFFVWSVIGSFPFALIAGILEIIRRYRS